MVLGELYRYMQENETQPPTYIIHKNKLKMVKDLNISHNTIKLLEQNIGRKISDIPPINIFTDTSPRTKEIKERINKWDLIKTVQCGIRKDTQINGTEQRAQK